MPKPRKLDKIDTSIKITWKDKDLMSKYKQKKQRAKDSQVEQFESDSEVFYRILMEYHKLNPLSSSIQPKSTYPALRKTSSKPISLTQE